MKETPTAPMDDEHRLQYCVYYDASGEAVTDFFPPDITPELKNRVISAWEQDIPRKILKELSVKELTMQELKGLIGHSNSTLHENIKKLEEAGIIYSKIIYEGNKIRVLAPRFLFVTRNPEFRTKVQKFFQGMWVNGENNKSVISFLQDNPDKYFTSDQIAAKTGIPVDEVEILLSNWDSQFTRSLSDFLKQKPFEKKVLYRGTP
jgi:DNA-binding Lrp family transcriptional regulator